MHPLECARSLIRLGHTEQNSWSAWRHKVKATVICKQTPTTADSTEVGQSQRRSKLQPPSCHDVTARVFGGVWVPPRMEMFNYRSKRSYLMLVIRSTRIKNYAASKRLLRQVTNLWMWYSLVWTFPYILLQTCL